MKKVRLIESDWGGCAHHAVGPLLLYGFEPEIAVIAERNQLIRLFDDARDEDFPSVLLLGQGFLNQLGTDLPSCVPENLETLKVICVGSVPNDQASKWHQVVSDKQLPSAVLDVLGVSAELLTNVMEAINSALKPRFDDAILSGAEFFCYDPEVDLELHLPMREVRDHYNKGTLRNWLEEIVRKADEKL